MTDDDLYINLPDDNELAFLQLEETFRGDLDKKTKNPNGHHAYMEYVNKITAAARALKSPVLDFFPDIKTMQIGNAIHFYTQMSPIIENYIIQIKIRRGRRVKGYSVALDAVTKEKGETFNWSDKKHC